MPNLDVESIRKMIGRIVSHLESEQDVYTEHGRRIAQQEATVKTHHQTLFGNPEDLERQPGIINEWRTTKRFMKLAIAALGTMSLRDIVEILQKMSQ